MNRHRKSVRLVNLNGIQFVDAPEFQAPDAGPRILARLPRSEKLENPGIGPGLRLTPDEELHYFRQMNFLKFTAAAARGSKTPQAAPHHDVESLLARALRIRNLLICSNFGLVGYLLKRSRYRSQEAYENAVCAAGPRLMRAVELFDFTRGVRFSTYAGDWIRFGVRRLATRTYASSGAHVDDEFDWLAQVPDPRPYRNDEEINRRQRAIIQQLLQTLPERDRMILAGRFGLDDAQAETREALGGRLGVSGDRVRQVELRALGRLQRVAKNMDIPGMA